MQLDEFIIKFCPAIILSIWADTHVLCALILFLILIDNACAIKKAHKFRVANTQWFDYKKLTKTIEKFISYSVALIASWILMRIIDFDIDILKGVASYIAIYESISIFVHLSEITGLDVFADLVKWLKGKLKFQLKNIDNASNQN
jgi:phage-related holin